MSNLYWWSKVDTKLLPGLTLKASFFTPHPQLRTVGERRTRMRTVADGPSGFYTMVTGQIESATVSACHSPFIPGFIL